jgi:MerR family transcriptional regulator, copper efflux regulator
MQEGTVEPIDFACTIDPAGLKQRVNQLDALAPRVLGLRRDGLTLALTFPAEATRDVQAFVVEESRCCPFFSFEVDEIHQGLRLGIRTPPGGEAMLDALQAGFAGNAAKLRARFEAVT